MYFVAIALRAHHCARVPLPLRVVLKVFNLGGTGLANEEENGTSRQKLHGTASRIYDDYCRVPNDAISYRFATGRFR